MLKFYFKDNYGNPEQWNRAWYTKTKHLLTQEFIPSVPNFMSRDVTSYISKIVEDCRVNFKYIKDLDRDIWFGTKYVYKTSWFSGKKTKIRAGDCEDFLGFVVEEFDNLGLNLKACKLVTLKNNVGPSNHMSMLINMGEYDYVVDIWPTTFSLIKSGAYTPVACFDPNVGKWLKFDFMTDSTLRKNTV